MNNALIPSFIGWENQLLKIANIIIKILMPEIDKNIVFIRKIEIVRKGLTFLLTPKNIKFITVHLSVVQARRTMQPGGNSVSSIINKSLNS